MQKKQVNKDEVAETALSKPVLKKVYPSQQHGRLLTSAVLDIEWFDSAHGNSPDKPTKTVKERADEYALQFLRKETV